jgi:trehalose/maltose transport system permease protein
MEGEMFGNKEKISKLAREEEKFAYKLLLPSILILIIIAIYPLGQVFVTSMTDKRFASNDEVQFVGLENYKQLLRIQVKELPKELDDNGNVIINDETGEAEYVRPFKVLDREPNRYKESSTFDFLGKKYVIGATDPDFIKSISNTLKFSIISVFLETILGLIVALVVNSKFKGRGAMRGIMLVPWAVITVVSARIWEWMLQPSRVGLFNTVLTSFGGSGSISFLSDRSLTLTSMIAIDVWKTTPYMALLILAGLQVIPGELYEAADIDGATKWQQFKSITLPLLKPALGVALIFRSLDALRVFDVFQVLLGSREYSMASYNYFQLIGNRNMGLASAIGVIIFIIIFAFAIMFIRSMGVNEENA